MSNLNKQLIDVLSTMLCHLPPRHLRLCCDTPMCSEERNKLNALTHLFIKYLPSACHAECLSCFSKCGVRPPGVCTSVAWVSQAESQKKLCLIFPEIQHFYRENILIKPRYTGNGMQRVYKLQAHWRVLSDSTLWRGSYLGLTLRNLMVES